MENEKNYLIVFDSKNHAYFLESLLMRKAYDVEYLQAPQYLSQSCSASLKIDKDSLKFAMEMIETFNLEVYRIYRKNRAKGKITYRVVNVQS